MAKKITAAQRKAMEAQAAAAGAEAVQCILSDPDFGKPPVATDIKEAKGPVASLQLKMKVPPRFDPSDIFARCSCYRYWKNKYQQMTAEEILADLPAGVPTGLTRELTGFIQPNPIKEPPSQQPQNQPAPTPEPVAAPTTSPSEAEPQRKLSVICWSKSGQSHFVSGVGVISIEENDQVDVYTVSMSTNGSYVGGTFQKVIPCPGGTALGCPYHVDAGRMGCECKGYKHHGKCRHHAALLKLVERGYLKS